MRRNCFLDEFGKNYTRPLHTEAHVDSTSLRFSLKASRARLAMRLPSREQSELRFDGWERTRATRTNSLETLDANHRRNESLSYARAAGARIQRSDDPDQDSAGRVAPVEDD